MNIRLIKHVLKAWNLRDKNKSKNESIERIANGYNMSNEEVKKIVEIKTIKDLKNYISIVQR